LGDIQYVFVVYRNVDRKPWEQIAKEHQGATVVVAIM